MNKNSLVSPSLSSKTLKRTIIIIPAFNEENTIADIILGIKEEFPQTEVVVIDDGSSDKTGQVAKERGAKVISHTNNMGYGIALQTGYKYALRHSEYEYIVQLDGDGQHNYKDIQKLLQPLVQDNADLVIGSRFLGNNKIYPISTARKVGMIFFRLLLFILSKKKIKDVTSGMQAFKRGVIKAYVSDEFPYYYPDSNVLLLQLKNGLRICEVSSSMKENLSRKSMHDGIGRQLFYVISLILSIFTISLRKLGGKHAH